MKILVFCPYYPPHIGGLESHADEFNKYLSYQGIDITVFTPQLPKDALEFEIKYNGVRITRFPAFEIISNYPLPKFWKIKFWKVFFGLFERKFDIVISRTRFFNTSFLALIYAKIKRVQWIHIEHGSDFVKLSSSFKSAIAKIYDYTFGHIVFKFSNQNISISKAVRRFVKKFDERESPVIYRGLDMERIDAVLPRNELKEKYMDKLIVSFVGRLYDWKGVENSIRAIKNLPEEIKNKIVFIIAGAGEDLERLQNILDKNDSIVFWGNIPNEKAIGLLKVTDIYLHSAFPGGGLSTSLLEAMYCKCAIIATPNEGADEVVENNQNGLLIKNNAPEIITKKIIELISSKEKKEFFGNNARQKIINNFNWKKSIDAYVEIFEK